jgi:hypothetical protein
VNPSISNIDHGDLARTRVEYARAGRAEEALPRLVDKLSARVAGDRRLVRTYEALASKLEAYGGFSGGPDEEALDALREETLAREHDARALLESLGGDFRATSRSAQLELHACRGLLDVVVDPRTELVASLETVLLAALVDREGWRTLVTLVEAGGVGADAIERVHAARAVASAHVERLRGWIDATRR